MFIVRTVWKILGQGMRRSSAVLAAFALAAASGLCSAAEAGSSRLVSAEWLQQRLGSGELRVLDGSPASLHRRGHIPGAVNADLFTFGPRACAAGA